MTTEELRQLLAEWCQSEGDLSEDLSDIRSLTDFLEQVLYEEYEPAHVGAQGEFPARLARWIGGAESDDDMRALYCLAGRLVFFGREQTMAGYRTAYSRNIALWLMKTDGLPFFGRDTETRLRLALRQTAFTEITDSFRLGDFLRWNNVAGHGTRYTWKQHLPRWDPTTFMQEVMGANSDAPRRNLVLMEDFIGTGDQMQRAVQRACSLPRDYNVLLCPIIICPEGAVRARRLEQRHPNFRYSPVMELPESTFIADRAVAGEHRHHPMTPHDTDVASSDSTGNAGKLAAGNLSIWLRGHRRVFLQVRQLSGQFRADLASPV